MKISSRLTIAIHIFACIYMFGKEHKITSDFLASSVNVNPVIIRKILLQLKASDLIKVKRGVGGASMAKQPNEITFFDIYTAVECVDDKQLFNFHNNPNQQCPIGKNIHNALDDKLLKVQISLENELKKITLLDVFSDIEYYIRIDSK